MGDGQVNISYDARVDALYIKLIPGKHRAIPKVVDDDIALNFDEQDRLVGIEILDASKRLEPGNLLPVHAAPYTYDGESLSFRPSRDSDWEKLRRELLQRKKTGVPVETLKQHRKNWVQEVGADYVILQRDRSGNTVMVTRSELEHDTLDQLKTHRKWSITQALRDIASF